MRWLNAIYKPTDALVLWLWDEFGWSWKQVHAVAASLAFVVGAARHSKWGHDYGLYFWTTTAFIGGAYLILLLMAAMTPTEARNRSSAFFRVSPAGAFMASWVILWTVPDFFVSDRRVLLDDGCFSLWWLINNAVIPIRPRKRREARVTRLAWSATS